MKEVGIALIFVAGMLVLYSTGIHEPGWGGSPGSGLLEGILILAALIVGGIGVLCLLIYFFRNAARKKAEE